MKRISSLLLSSLLLVGCGDKKDISGKGTPAPNIPEPNTPTPTNDPFKNGFCEVSIGGAAPKKTGSSPSTKYWKDEVPWATKIFCDGFELVGYGDDSSIPMKPGSYQFYKTGGPKTGVFGIFGAEDYNVEGEVNIKVWDDNSLKGTFIAKGSYGTKGTTQYKAEIIIEGSFENKRADTTHKPFLGGTCEVTSNEGLPQYYPGNQFAISTAYWAGPNTKNPSGPLQLNCGKYNFSANGETKDFPMKPGKYSVSPKNEPGSLSLISPVAMPDGEVNIESWDMMGIKGTFIVKGTKMFDPDNTPMTVTGSFDFTCPYTKPGEPCLEKPAQ